MNRYALLLVAVTFLPAMAFAQGQESSSAQWDDVVAESAASQLSDSLFRISDSARAIDTQAAAREERTRTAFAALAADVDYLASELRSGRDREETEVLFRNLELRRALLLQAGVGSPVELPKQDVEEARFLWDQLAEQYRTR